MTTLEGELNSFLSQRKSRLFVSGSYLSFSKLMAVLSCIEKQKKDSTIIIIEPTYHAVKAVEEGICKKYENDSDYKLMMNQMRMHKIVDVKGNRSIAVMTYNMFINQCICKDKSTRIEKMIMLIDDLLESNPLTVYFFLFVNSLIAKEESCSVLIFNSTISLTKIMSFFPDCQCTTSKENSETNKNYSHKVIDVDICTKSFNKLQKELFEELQVNKMESLCLFKTILKAMDTNSTLLVYIPSMENIQLAVDFLYSYTDDFSIFYFPNDDEFLWVNNEEEKNKKVILIGDKKEECRLFIPKIPKIKYVLDSCVNKEYIADELFTKDRINYQLIGKENHFIRCSKIEAENGIVYSCNNTEELPSRNDVLSINYHSLSTAMNHLFLFYTMEKSLACEAKIYDSFSMAIQGLYINNYINYMKNEGYIEMDGAQLMKYSSIGLVNNVFHMKEAFWTRLVFFSKLFGVAEQGIFLFSLMKIQQNFKIFTKSEGMYELSQTLNCQSDYYCLLKAFIDWEKAENRNTIIEKYNIEKHFFPRVKVYANCLCLLLRITQHNLEKDIMELSIFDIIMLAAFKNFYYNEPVDKVQCVLKSQSSDCIKQYLDKHQFKYELIESSDKQCLMIHMKEQEDVCVLYDNYMKDIKEEKELKFILNFCEYVNFTDYYLQRSIKSLYDKDSSSFCNNLFLFSNCNIISDFVYMHKLALCKAQSILTLIICSRTVCFEVSENNLYYSSVTCEDMKYDLPFVICNEDIYSISQIRKELNALYDEYSSSARKNEMKEIFNKFFKLYQTFILSKVETLSSSSYVQLKCDTKAVKEKKNKFKMKHKEIIDKTRTFLKKSNSDNNSLFKSITFKPSYLDSIDNCVMNKEGIKLLNDKVELDASEKKEVTSALKEIQMKVDEEKKWKLYCSECNEDIGISLSFLCVIQIKEDINVIGTKTTGALLADSAPKKNEFTVKFLLQFSFPECFLKCKNNHCFGAFISSKVFFTEYSQIIIKNKQKSYPISALLSLENFNKTLYGTPIFECHLCKKKFRYPTQLKKHLSI